MKLIFGIIIQRFALSFRNRGMRLFFALSFLLIVISTAIMSLNLIGEIYSYKIGDIAKESIRVPWDITYSIEFETNQERRFAAEMVPPVYEKDPYVLAEKTRIVNNIFNNVETVLTSKSGYSRDEQVKLLSEMLPENNRYDKKILYAIINYSSIEELRRTVLNIINAIYEKGVIDDSSTSDISEDEKNIIIRTKTDERNFLEEKRHYNDLYILSKLRNTVHIVCSKYTSDLPRDQQWVVFIVTKGLIRANVRYDDEETKRRMVAASDRVQPVKAVLKKGQVIVRDGDSITIDIQRKLQVVNKYSQKIHLNYVLGIFIIQFLVYIIFLVNISSKYHKIVPDSRTSIVISILLVFFMVYSYFMSAELKAQDSSVISALLLPLPFIAMMISILYNTHLAVIASSFALFFCYTLSGGDYAGFGVGVSSVMVSIIGTRNLEKRTDFLRTGLLIGVVNTIVCLGFGLMEERTFPNILYNAEIALAAGIINAMAVIGIFPVFEHFFGITTVFKMHELSDLNAPIFKKMLIRAPGTYNHSIMVANMAESACREIDADFLLARVGGYYHDIGKIENAHIYIENKKIQSEPIDIPPEEYSQMIISHVEKGVEIAKKTKLPQDIIDFIREHHGDSMMTFFYHQALEKAQETGDIESVHRSYFQYPGPKPHTKETAVVMLADAIEAASRSLQEPSYAKLENLVKNIIYSRLNEGDLEHSDLTMQDLEKIQKAFLRIINGVFHTRIEYPQKDEIKKLEQMIKSNGSD
jgi:putative nucleotidyltransferase with HDIG domain